MKAISIVFKGAYYYIKEYFCLSLWLGEAAEGPSVLAHLQEKKDGSTGTVLQHLPQESARPRNPFTATFWGSFLARRLPWEGDRTDARVPSSRNSGASHWL